MEQEQRGQEEVEEEQPHHQTEEVEVARLAGAPGEGSLVPLLNPAKKVGEPGAPAGGVRAHVKVAGDQVDGGVRPVGHLLEAAARLLEELQGGCPHEQPLLADPLDLEEGGEGVSPGRSSPGSTSPWPPQPCPSGRPRQRAPQRR